MIPRVSPSYRAQAPFAMAEGLLAWLSWLDNLRFPTFGLDKPPKPLLTEAEQMMARQQVAVVLHKVFWEEWTPLQGLARWPIPVGQDASIDVAFQALAYLEGDEDRHQTEPYWLDAQLTWIKTIQAQLALGQPLSPSVIAAYQQFSQEHMTSPAWESWLLVAPVVQLWRNALKLLQCFPQIRR